MLISRGGPASRPSFGVHPREQSGRYPSPICEAKGQLHVPGRDVEQCLRCQGQMLSCACEVTEKFEDDEGEQADGAG